MSDVLVTKLQNILDNKNTNLKPENLKKGVTVLGVEGSFDGVPINNQDKTITENGTYIADEGYTGLGQVIVNVPQGSSDFKSFETIEQMQADTTAKKGDKAVIYNKKILNMKPNKPYSVMYIPDEIRLSQPFNSSSSYSTSITFVQSSSMSDFGSYDVYINSAGTELVYRASAYQNGTGREVIRITFTSTDKTIFTNPVVELVNEEYNKGDLLTGICKYYDNMLILPNDCHYSHYESDIAYKLLEEVLYTIVDNVQALYVYDDKKDEQYVNVTLNPVVNYNAESPNDSTVTGEKFQIECFNTRSYS